jgi:aryl-alcohol dehydrogenase-like predicted oxidoreductase
MTALRKRRLGRTDLWVSELGFGGAHVAGSPQGEEALVRAFILGVDFVETGRLYRGSEYMIGRALRRLRDGGVGVHVASKTLARSRDGALRDLERSLDHLGREKIDVYQACNVGEGDWEPVMAPGGALDALKEARENGLIRFVGISSHSPQVLRLAIESGEFDTVQLAYSPFSRAAEGAMRLAHRRDIGVIVMKPVGGFGMPGSLKGSPYEERLSPATLIHYALSNARMSVVVPGMRFPSEVEENVALARTYEAMAPGRRARVRRLAEAFMAEAAVAPIMPRPGAAQASEESSAR